MVALYRVLIVETKAYIHATGFKLIIYLLPERSASAILVQSLAERWWDITYTFHHMTGLRCDEALINLEDESAIQLGIDLLERRYTTEMICYFNIEMDYRPLP